MGHKMSNTATIKDNHLYITYEIYDYGYRTKQKIIPLENIECIKANVGKRGGMHTWSIRGYDPEYSNQEYNKDRKRDIQLFCGDRKDTDLLALIRELLQNCNYREATEDGGAPW